MGRLRDAWTAAGHISLAADIGTWLWRVLVFVCVGIFGLSVLETAWALAAVTLFLTLIAAVSGFFFTGGEILPRRKNGEGSGRIATADAEPIDKIGSKERELRLHVDIHSYSFRTMEDREGTVVSVEQTRVTNPNDIAVSLRVLLRVPLKEPFEGPDGQERKALYAEPQVDISEAQDANNAETVFQNPLQIEPHKSVPKAGYGRFDFVLTKSQISNLAGDVSNVNFIGTSIRFDDRVSKLKKDIVLEQLGEEWRGQFLE